MNKSISLGLKLWSTNYTLADTASDLIEKGFYSYIELFAVPDSFQDTCFVWKRQKLPYVIHAAHSASGLNFSKADSRSRNLQLASEAFRFADQLDADKVIFHPGLDGNLEETISQMKSVVDGRMLIENKPAIGLGGEKCIGSTVEEVEKIIDETGVGFCLDLGHAICAANVYRVEPFSLIRRFIKLAPRMFHLTDGCFTGTRDSHLHYGEGDYPLMDLVKILPIPVILTNEARRLNMNELFEAIEDSKFLRAIWAKLHPNN
ncbi:MAG: TIM barrel protein [Candidatus Zixiibacteriota bacterium]